MGGCWIKPAPAFFYSIYLGMGTNLPIIIVGGASSSGKDTVADYIAKLHHGVCVAQADPIKRYVKALFGFSDDQLWGTQAIKNAPDHTVAARMGEIVGRFENVTEDWFAEIFPDIDDEDYDDRFAKLKDIVHDLLNHAVDKDKPITPRLCMQILGTEFGREMDKDLWSDLAIGTCMNLLDGGFTYDKTTGLVDDDDGNCGMAIISDGRFRNEILNVRMWNGVGLKLLRATDDDIQKAGAVNHASEAINKIPDHFFNYVMNNNGTLDELYHHVQQIMERSY
jgi:hypothetical protein